MDNLRFVLLVIGCLSVLGIYLWEILRDKEPKKRADILNAVDETPDTPISSISTTDITNDNFSHDVLANLGSLLTQSRNESVDVTASPEAFHFPTSEEAFNDDSEKQILAPNSNSEP